MRTLRRVVRSRRAPTCVLVWLSTAKRVSLSELVRELRSSSCGGSAWQLQCWLSRTSDRMASRSMDIECSSPLKTTRRLADCRMLVHYTHILLRTCWKRT